MKLAIVAAFAAVLGLVSCADSVESGANRVSGWSYKTLRDNVNIFEASLPDADENDFVLKFSVQDGGNFLYTVNADNELKNGIDFKFARTGTALAVTVAAQGNTVEVSEELAGQLGNVEGELNFKLTVHNNEDGSSHIVFKNMAGAEVFELHGEHEHEAAPAPAATPAAAAAEAAIAVNNLADEHKHSPGKGDGSFFGFAATNASFLSMDAVKSAGH